MGLESSTSFQISNIHLDLILPNSKQVIYLYSQIDNNYDEKSFRGVLKMKIAAIQTLLPDYKAVLINSRELKHGEDHLSKVNYLLKSGIESKVQNYDFTHIKADSEKEKEDD